MARFRGARTGVLVAVLFAACGESSDDPSESDAKVGSGGSESGGSAGIVGGGGAQLGAAGEGQDAAADVSSGGSTADGAAGSRTGGAGGMLVDGCTPLGFELCNGKDDDCDGVLDNGFDFLSTTTCGACTNNCLLLPHTTNTECIPPAVLDGKTPGTCQYDCQIDHYDLNGSIPGCEYFCPWNPSGTNSEDGDSGICSADDDCDGQVDEDVDLCGVANCGKCGKKCLLPHATEGCAKVGDASAACGPANTVCTIVQCDPGWDDADGNVANGCETPTDGG